MTPRYLGHKNIQHRVRYSSSPPNTLPFRLTDAAGRILAHVYFEDEPTRRNFSKQLVQGRSPADGPANPAPARAGPDCQGD
jgi:hypothetical protein